MKISGYIIVLLITFLTSFSEAYAADNAGIGIAVVDIKRIVEESSAAKDISKQIDAKRDKFQKEVTKDEDALRKEDQDLAKQRNALSKEAFDQKAKDFRNKVVEAQRKVQMKRTQLENAYVKALSKVQDATLAIIKDLASQKGFAVAIPKSQILYSQDQLDISEEVLKELNKRLPKVEVVIEEIKEEKKKE